jgi:hypothetical protein
MKKEIQVSFYFYEFYIMRNEKFQGVGTENNFIIIKKNLKLHTSKNIF